VLEFKVDFVRGKDDAAAIEIQLLASGERATVAKEAPILTERILIPKVGFQPKGPQPFIPSMLKSIPADAPSDIVRIDKGLVRLGNAQRVFQREKSDAENQIQEALKDQRNGQAKAAPWRKAVENLNVKLGLVAEAEKNLKEARRITETVAAWCTEVSPQFEELRGKVTLEYEVSMPGTGDEYFLVQTKGFENNRESSSPE